MGNLSVNNGGIATNKGGMPSIDLRYGPYESAAAAYAQLGPDGDDVITPGLTVGFISGSTVTEYWFQGGTALANLVPKQSGGGTGTTPTNREEFNIALTETKGYIDSSNIFRPTMNHMLYPVTGFDKVVIYPNEQVTAFYAFLTDNVLTVGETPHFASGFTGRRSTGRVAEFETDIPSDAAYFYLYMSSESEGFVPQGLKLVRETSNDSGVTEVQHSGASPASFVVNGGEYHTFDTPLTSLAFTIGNSRPFEKSYLEFTTASGWSGSPVWPNNPSFAPQEPVLVPGTTYLISIIHGIISCINIFSAANANIEPISDNGSIEF